MLKKIVLALVALIAVFLVVVALQPSDYRVSRSLSMAVPPDAVYAQVADFHHWPQWSPWAKRDPAMKTTFEGADSGVGAIYGWSGNDQVGTGRMTITDVQPGALIRLRLEFIKPFQGVSTTEFAFSGEGAETLVTWTMFGQRSFLEKGLCLFMNMDKMIGGDFEKGLESLKMATMAAAPPEQIDTE